MWHELRNDNIKSTKSLKKERFNDMINALDSPPMDVDEQVGAKCVEKIA